jgi:flagellar biosynthesis protein FlhG
VTAPTAISGRRGLTSIAVTSGKGGVGKTNVVVNLAVALARLRNRVAILDADFGLGNVDVLLGLAPSAHLGHLLSGEKTLRDITVPGPLGVHIIPASSGLRELTMLNDTQWQRLSGAVDELRSDFDFLLIDTGAGISSNVIDMVSGAERVLLVTSYEPAALVDAYAMIKVLVTCGSRQQIGVLVNGARDGAEANLVFRQLDIAATHFLQRHLEYYGFVPYDDAVRDSILLQRPVVDHLPQSAASRSFRILASRITNLAPLGGPGLRLVRKPETPTIATEEPRCA